MIVELENTTQSIMKCYFLFSSQQDVMASHDTALGSSPLMALLSSILPKGFAVGPSRVSEGRLGLWWVGRCLDAGTMLGREGDTEWSWMKSHEPDCDPSNCHPGDDPAALNACPKEAQTYCTNAREVIIIDILLVLRRHEQSMFTGLQVNNV